MCEENPNFDIKSLTIRINQQKQRCDELNNVKLVIKQMNDGIKNNVFLNMDQVVSSFKKKLQEFSDVLKNKLNLQYDCINDKKLNLSIKIENLLEWITKKAEETELKEPNEENRNKKLKELYLDSLMQTKDIEDQLNGFTINELYPNLYFNIPMNQIDKSIESVKLEIFDRVNLLEKNFTNFVEVSVDQAFDCVLSSGLDDDGVFYIQPASSQVDLIIDEVSKFVRYKRITDSTWLTFREENKQPELKEKCFGLNSAIQKWMRCIVESLDTTINCCKVRYLDSYHHDNEISFANLIRFRSLNNFLDNCKFQSIKCCLFIKKDKKKLIYCTKHLFKDFTSKIKCKCILKELIEEDIWLVHLYNSLEYDTEKLASIHPINKFIIDDYEQNLGLNTDKNLIKDLLSSIISTIEFNNNIFLQTFAINIPSPEILTNLIMDDHDSLYESDEESSKKENKNYSGFAGVCYISRDINKNGIFWISPKLSTKYLLRYDTISKEIENFIKNSKQLSFDYLNTIKFPVKNGMRCFVRCLDKKQNQDYRRALIEQIDFEKTEATVYLLDRGSVETVKFGHMYPYAKLDDIDDIKFKTIRCVISNDTNLILTGMVAKLFNEFRQNSIVRYILIEKVVVNKLICWYTGLQMSDNRFLNDILLGLNKNKDIKQSEILNKLIGNLCNMSIEEQHRLVHSDFKNEEQTKMLGEFYNKNLSRKKENKRPHDYSDYYRNDLLRNKNYQPYHPDSYEQQQQEQHQHYHVAKSRDDYLRMQENRYADQFTAMSRTEAEKPFKSQRTKQKLQQEQKELNRNSKINDQLTELDKHSLIHQISSFSKRPIQLDDTSSTVSSIYNSVPEYNIAQNCFHDHSSIDEKELKHVHSSLCSKKHFTTEPTGKLKDYPLVRARNEPQIPTGNVEEKEEKLAKSRIIYSTKSFHKSKKSQDPKLN